MLLLAAVQFTHIVDFMIIMPLGADFMQVFGISPGQFSLLVATYAGCAFAASLIGAPFIDRFDRKAALLFTYGGFLLGTVACGLAPGFGWLLISRGLAGAFGGVIATLVLSIIGDAVPYERRASAMGIVMTAFSAASVVGVPSGLWLAAQYGWRMPFFAVGALSLVAWGLAARLLPSLRGHLVRKEDREPPLRLLSNVFRSANQRKALFFSLLLILGHFTIIPFIAPYMELNVGFTKYQITYIYFAGGLVSVVVLPLVGRLGDRWGNKRVFTFGSFIAVGSILALTHLSPVPLWVGLLVTSSYFLAGGSRTVPATTLVTSVVSPQNRGGFMSLRTSVNQLAMGLSSALAGAIVTMDEAGRLLHYDWVGYVAVGMSLLAVGFVRRLRVVS